LSLYEGMFLMDNRHANRDWDGSLETLESMLTKHGAEILRRVKWGERRLAYDINGRRRATYVLVYFQANGEAVGNVYRECELSELILRALILKIQKLPPEGETVPADGAADARRPAHAAAEKKPKAEPAAAAAPAPATKPEEPSAAEEAAAPDATAAVEDAETEAVTPKTESE